MSFSDSHLGTMHIGMMILNMLGVLTLFYIIEINTGKIPSANVRYGMLIWMVLSNIVLCCPFILTIFWGLFSPITEDDVS